MQMEVIFHSHVSTASKQDTIWLYSMPTLARSIENCARAGIRVEGRGVWIWNTDPWQSIWRKNAKLCNSSGLYLSF